MALYIQHGYGKSDKITSALERGTVGGVVFGARNEKPENLQAYLDEIRKAYEGCELLLDPQFYVSTLNPPNERYLRDYPYYSSGLTASDFARARHIRQHVSQTLDYQVDLGLKSLLSPTVPFGSFSDQWYQIALNLADASLEHRAQLTNPPPLLLSFVFKEGALADAGGVKAFLDTVTQDEWDMDGYYVIVDRGEKVYNQRFEPSRLAQYLYIVYVLGRINGLRVICGYADLVGIPLRAVGAEVFATGWSQSLREFRRSSFIKRRPGGRPARERYSSIPLMNSVLLSELQQVHQSGHLADALSGVPLDSQMESAPDPLSAGWTMPVSQQHHWQTLQALDASLSGSVRPDLRDIVGRLSEADGLYTLLAAKGVEFEANTGREHLKEWAGAIAEFQRMVGLRSS